MVTAERKLDVVVVDDSDDIRELVRRWSRRYGHVVVDQACDGLRAIEIAGRNQPDVLVLDVRMPGVDGLQAIPGIRAASPNTRIVMLSAYPEYREQALTLGAHAWVTKSTDFGQLLAALRPEPSTGP